VEPPVEFFGWLEGESAAHKSSPLVSKFSENLLGRKIELDLGGGQAIVAQEALHGWQGDPLLDRRDREGMTQDMRGHRPADVRPVSHALDQAQHRAGVMPKVS
jgi:hypothetical protein